MLSNLHEHSFMLLSQFIIIYIMTESQEDCLAKKLHMLQTDNSSLRQQRQEFELNLRRYVKSISQMEDQLRTIKRENEQLQLDNRQMNLKNRQKELTIQRLNEEYRTLYEHIHLDTRKSTRGIILKELELSNQLSNIHNQSYEAAIHNMKQSLQQKNQQLVELNQETAKLKMDLLKSTHQYNQIINNLKAQLCQIKAEQQYLIKRPSFSVQKEKAQKESQRIAEEQLIHVRSELSLVEKEYQKLSTEFLKCQKQLNHYKSEAEWLKVSKETNQLQQSPMDFHQIRIVVQENLALKKQLDSQVERYSFLMRSNPALMSQMNQIDLISPMQELQQKYEQLMTKSGQQAQQIIILTSFEKKLESEKNQIQSDYANYKAQSVKVFNKLKQYINNYIPCFQLYGYEQFLNEEESKFIQQTGTDIYKEYDRMSMELSQKTNQLKKVESRLKQVENQQKKKESTYNGQSALTSNLKEQNRKLNSTIEALTEQIDRLKQRKLYPASNRSHRSRIQQINNEMEYVQQEQYRGEGQRFAQEYPGSEEERQQRNPSSEERVSPEEEKRVISDSSDQLQELLSEEELNFPVGNKTRVESLEQLVVQLNKYIHQSKDIIIQKDQLIAEANAQLKVLRSQSQAKNYTFESQKQTFDLSIPLKINTDSTQDLLTQSKQEYLNLKKQISSMGQLYETELQLMQQEYQNKYTSLNIKYVDLLTNYKDLQHKFTLLEQLYEDSTRKNKQQDSHKAQSVHSENIGEVEGQEIVVRDDRNVISEATIQSINDLLKKYEKQFNRFTSLYEQAVIKTKGLKTSEANIGDTSAQEELSQKIQRIVGILNQNQQTIDLLHQENDNKEKNLQELRQLQAQKDSKYKEEISLMEERLTSLMGQLESIRGKNMQESGEGSQGRPQLLNSFMGMLNHKNQEINALQQTFKEKESENAQLRSQVEALENQVNTRHSTLEQEEYRRLKEFLVESDLLSVLEKINLLMVKQEEKVQQNPQSEMISE